MSSIGIDWGVSSAVTSSLEVLTYASSYDLTNKDTVKSELGITNTNQDVNITLWIRQASDEISNTCGRVFAEEVVVETFKLMNHEVDKLILYPGRRPVSVISSVTIDDSVIDPANYELDQKRGFLYLLDDDGDRRYWGSMFPSSFSTMHRTRKVVVEYTAGVALLDDLPYDIERACIMLVKSYAASATRLDSALRAEEIPGVLRQEWQVVRGTDPASFPPEVERILRNYRIPVI